MGIDTQIINSTGQTIVSVNLPEDTRLVVATIVLAIVTAVLAGVTWKLAKESGLMRKISQNPSFALEPTLYSLGGTFHMMNIINTGAIAKNIRIDCKWNKSGDDAHAKIKRFYILSLSMNGRARFEDVPIEEIIKNKEKLTVHITCKDSRDEEYTQTLDEDFSKLTADGREIGYQFDMDANISSSLSDIARNIRSIR